jgi:hypothetical protein
MAEKGTQMRERRGAAREVRSVLGDATGPAGTDEGDAPARDVLDALHARLVRGDPTAPPDLESLVFATLVRQLRKRAGRRVRGFGSTVGDDLLMEAAEEAFISYAKRPDQYDPAKARGGLLPYLLMSAEHDLLNALPRAERHRSVTPLSRVELRAEGRNTELRLVGIGTAGYQENPEEMMEARALAEEWSAQLAVQEALLETTAERSVLRHMIAGERSTAAYAAVLGITHLDPKRQQLEVKRVKDKIKKRLVRAGLPRFGGASHE